MLEGMRSESHRRLNRPVVALACASVFCVTILDLGIAYSHDASYSFLDWNLFLAWIPLAMALAVERATRNDRVALKILAGLGWLLFFPNAPYILTDFVHLERWSSTNLLLDAAMLVCFACTALLIGLLSLYVMHMTWRRGLGNTVAWLCVSTSLLLASLGVCIGRYVHLNSWDAITHPGKTTAAIVAVTSPEHLWLSLALIGFTALLGLAYALFYGLVLAAESRRTTRVGYGRTPQLG